MKTAAACALLLLVSAPAAAQRTVGVATAAELEAAVRDAAAGDTIVLASGTYALGHRLDTRVAGTAALPIVVRSASRGTALVRFSSATGVVEGFVVTHAHWRFEDLVLEGDCADHSDCEHAWHVVGEADFTVIRGNVARGFNAHIKANGADLDGARPYPDDVLVEGNEFYGEGPRMTANPVTPIDVVGGRRWVIRANFIHDHQKGMGDGVSYAAFLKGNGRDGVIERNLVVCELLHSGGTRLGLSFGGGGSGPDRICEDRDCSVEHQGGVMRNNIVAHCPADVGIYVNECAGCAIVHNTVFDATGIDLRFATTDVVVAGNLTSGRIRDRDGASSARENNLEEVTAWAAFFVDPDALDFSLRDGSTIVDLGGARPDVPDDFCGNRRDDGVADLGAVEYDGDGPCDTTRAHPGEPPTPGPDAGGPERDAGSLRDGGSTRDGGPIADGGLGEPDAGCGCSAPGRSELGARLEGLLLLGGLLGLRRRRRVS